MIKVIKIGNLIYENIEPKFIDESGNEIWNIPNNAEDLKRTLVDTLGWIVGQNIIKAVGDANKKDTATSKAIVLLAKVISTLNPDLDSLTDTEKSIFEKMNQLGSIGYSDSELLNNTFEQIITNLNWYKEKVEELENLNTLDELVEFAERL